MSYKLTVYFNDSYINSTDVESTYFSHRGYYGDDMYVAGALSFPVKLKANPSSGGEFTRWVYRLGSTTGTVRYSYSNPFTYSGDQDIYIRAEGSKSSSSGGGGGDDDDGDGGSSNSKWFIVDSSLEGISNIGSYTGKNVQLENNQILRIAVKFDKSGVATFYTTSTADDVDTYGFLTTKDAVGKGTPDDYAIENGVPQDSGCLCDDDDSGTDLNFKIQHDVVAGEKYYLWVRTAEGASGGKTNIHIIWPKDGGGDSGDLLPGIDIERWSWNAMNFDAMPYQTQEAYQAINYGLKTTSFHHQVWNDMVKKVYYDILLNTEDQWNNRYATMENTLMTNDDKELTADRFNSLRYNVDLRLERLGLATTGISEQKSRDQNYPVRGDYLKKITDGMNRWIDAIKKRR